jgi:hypothetical protein
MTTSHEDRLAGSSRLTANGGRRKPLGMNSLTCQYGAKPGMGNLQGGGRWFDRVSSAA